MRNIKVAVIIISLLFLIACQNDGITGLVSYEDYQDLLTKYENDSYSETSQSFSATIEQELQPEQESAFLTDQLSENETYTLSNNSTGNTTFGVSAVYYENDCFTASSIGGLMPNDIIYLTNDIYKNSPADCVVLDVANIIFDCNGSTITGNSPFARDGIYIESDNVRVQNCIITNFSYAQNISTIPGIWGYEYSNGIEVSRTLGFNVTIYNTTIYNINPLGYGGSGIRYAGGYTGYLLVNKTKIYNCTNGIRVEKTTDVFGDLLTGPFSVYNSNISGNKYFQYLAYNTAGNHNLINTTFLAGNNERSVQITGNYTEFLAGNYLENVTIQECTFQEGPLNFSDIFIARAKNVNLQQNSLYRNTYLINSTIVNLLNNTFADTDTSNFSLPAIYFNNVSTYVINDNLNIPKLFSIVDSPAGSIVNNSFTRNGRISINEEHNIGANTLVIQRNNFTDLAIQGQTSGGIFFKGTSTSLSLINNNFIGGKTYSLHVVGNNAYILNNYVRNTIGNAFIINGDDNYIFNNTIYNHTGTVFRIDGEDNNFLNNTITFVLKYMNTTLNYASSNFQQVSESGDAFLLLNTTRNNITGNNIFVSNPLSLIIGIYGIRSINETISLNGTPSTAETINVTINNNIFSTPVLINHMMGLKTAIYLKDSYDANITKNQIYNSEHQALILDGGRKNLISKNLITTTLQNNTPYYSEVGIKLFRTKNNTLQENNITYYDTGIYCLNSSFDTINFNVINFSSRHAMFFFKCYNETNIGNEIYNATAGIKLLFTNNSYFNLNIIIQTVIGIDLNKAFNNTFVSNSQDTSEIGVNLDLFSANNVFNTNTFQVNTDVDILYDMFATTNTGVGNGGPTVRSENYASGNNIV